MKPLLSDDVWEAFAHAHLKDFIEEKQARKLDNECGEEGENLR